MADLLGTDWLPMHRKLLFLRQLLQVLHTEHTQLVQEFPRGLTAHTRQHNLSRRRRKRCRALTREIQTLENSLQALTQRLVDSAILTLLVVMARDPETRDTLHSAIHAAGGTDTCRWPDPCPPPLRQTSMVTLQLDDEAHVTPAPAVGVEDDDTDTDAAGSKGGS